MTGFLKGNCLCSHACATFLAGLKRLTLYFSVAEKSNSVRPVIGHHGRTPVEAAVFGTLEVINALLIASIRVEDYAVHAEFSAVVLSFFPIGFGR